jgi:hypothetical protein
MLSLCVCSLSLCLSRLGVMHVSQRSSLMVSHPSVFSHQQIVKVKTFSGFGLGRCPVNRRRHYIGGGRPVKGIRGKNYYPEGVENFLLPLTETGGKPLSPYPLLSPYGSSSTSFGGSPSAMQSLQSVHNFCGKNCQTVLDVL